MDDLRLIYSIAVALSCLAFYLGSRTIVRIFGRRKNLKIRRQEVLSKFLLFCTMVLAALLMVIIWGFDIKNIWIFASSFLGLFGIALFASWSLLSNIVSSFILFFTVPFHIGDVIEIRDNEVLLVGHIEDLTLFYIFLRTDDNKVVIIPNNVALQRIVVRHSRKGSAA